MDNETISPISPPITQVTIPSNNQGDAKLNGKATTSLVLGIIGIIAWLLPILGLPITIVGLIFGIKGTKSLKHGIATAGIVLSIIGLVLTIANASIGAYMGATDQHPVVNKILEMQNQGQKTTSKKSMESTGSDLKSNIINEAIKSAKEQITLPYKIDELTTLVNLTAESGAIRYHYILSGANVEKLSDDILKKSLIAGVCQNKQTKNFIDQDINMEYSYTIKNSTQKYFVSVSKSNCK
ncbi:MAG: DUF4190 domain-containing protein [Candidatus Roizmanbacteria bacterium]